MFNRKQNITFEYVTTNLKKKKSDSVGRCKCDKLSQKMYKV